MGCLMYILLLMTLTSVSAQGIHFTLSLLCFQKGALNFLDMQDFLKIKNSFSFFKLTVFVKRNMFFRFSLKNFMNTKFAYLHIRLLEKYNKTIGEVPKEQFILNEGNYQNNISKSKLIRQIRISDILFTLPPCCQYQIEYYHHHHWCFIYNNVYSFLS